MDPSQDRSQDLSQDILSQDPPQENTFPLPVAVVEPHAIPLPIPLSPLFLVPSSPPPSSPPSPSPPLSPIASSSNLNANPSSSLTPPQSLAVTHYMPPLLYYAPAPAGQYIQPGWNPDTGLPVDVWLHLLNILYERRNTIALVACALTCRYLLRHAQRMINNLNIREIRSWMYEDIDRLVEDVRDTPRDVKNITSVEFVPEERDDKSPGSAVALSVAPLRLAVLRHCSGSLQEAEIFLASEVRRSQGDFVRDSWLDAFKPGSPIAETVELWTFNEKDIPMMKTFISRHMGPTQILKLKATQPTTEDFYSFSWKTLDILFFSWYMLHGRGNGITLFFGFWVPQELRDEQQTVKEEATKVKGNPWLHSLFPLNMAVGKGMWLG
ncbi:hypothetical protein NLI96_g7596 [Meripilus lineatus]|uniref:Uncharacterized protein n=1 Tax=Meripilus lineatus TaxID=2056292 RepID=A0AAD5UYY3_9APHY|nr:hypothetical protein NLI96_g7596 [Physisporinus lineatus]